MKKLILPLVLVSSFSQAHTVLASDSAPVRRALIIGLDGTTGAQLQEQTLNGGAPAIRQLMKDGKFASCADAEDPHCARAHSGPKAGDGFRWLTGPGWASVLTGVDNSKTLLKNNDPKSLEIFAQTSREYPTFLMRLRHELNYKVSAGGVGAFMTSSNHGELDPGVLDFECGLQADEVTLKTAAETSSCNLNVRHAGDGKDPQRDQKLAAWIKTQIADPETRLVMGVFDQIDAEGHRHGFGSNKNYLQAISNADVLVGQLVAAVKHRVQHNHEEWLIITTSDHGGHDVFIFGNHGTREFKDSAVPFIVTTYGENIPPLRDLESPVSHMDTHPTVMQWFGRPSLNADGKIQALP